MEERSSPLRVQTSVSLPEIPGKAKDIVFKLDMHRRSSDCAYSSIRLQLNNADICVVPCRTDRAVLAVNGFAADGNMFVKTVKQRLEVRCLLIVVGSCWFGGVHSGIVMPMRKTCPSVPLPAWYKRCCMQSDSSHTTCTTFWEALRKMVWPVYVRSIPLTHVILRYHNLINISICRDRRCILLWPCRLIWTRGVSCSRCGPIAGATFPWQPSKFLYLSLFHSRSSQGAPTKIYFKNQVSAAGTSHPAHLPLPTVLSIVIDSFTSATERHIEVRFAITSHSKF